MLLALAGCAAPQVVDPTGTWDITLTWGTGTCGIAGASPASTVVTRAGDDYRISESGQTLSGSILCSEAACRMTFTESVAGRPGSGIDAMTLSVTLSVGPDNAIAGAGRADVRRIDGSMCTQAFSAAGVLR